jgi:hypothetical protein
MPDFLEYLRQQNIFGVPSIYGNDLPEQGGITGNMFPSINDEMQRLNPLPPPATSLPQPINAPTGGMPMDTGTPPTFDVSGMFGGSQNPFDVNLGSSNIQGGIPTPQGPQGDIDVAARMKELYQPTSDAEQRFNQLVSEYPEAQKPGWLRVIGATLADMARPGTGMGVIEGNRARQLADWKNKVGPTQQEANLERYENTNKRTLAYQQISMELRDKAQEAREKNDTRNAEIRQQRADIYGFKAAHPNMKFVMTKGGNVTALDPATGEAHDTGIPTGSLTELDKMNLQQEMRLGQIGATGAEARRTEETRQAGRETIAETRGWAIANIEDPNNPGKTMAVKINAITGEVAPVKLGEKNVGLVTKPSAAGGAGGKGELPTQTRIREFIAAREVMNSSPALSKWIHLGRPGSNDFTIDKPGRNYFGTPTGPSVSEYNTIVKQIYGQPVPSHAPTGGPTGGGQKPLTEAPPAPPGYKYVPKAGGGWTAIKIQGEGFD